jgi:hypothetical protein
VDKATWEANMLEWGVINGDKLPTFASSDEQLNWVYYDQTRVMYQIADYVGATEPWYTYAKNAVKVFRDDYVLPNGGAVPGYENFTRGLRLDYEKTGDVVSKDAAIALSKNAMYAADNTDRTYIVHHSKSREVAYAIFGYINAEALGEAKRGIRAEWVTQSYDYIRQWQDSSTWGQSDEISPFMMAITAMALIEDWEETQDARCLPALQGLADWMWPLAYHAETHALYYSFNPGNHSTQGAPDLNMLIAPWFSWLWVQTGDAKYRDCFDELLLGHASAYLEQGKQFDQNYWLAFDGMAWREGGAA